MSIDRETEEHEHRKPSIATMRENTLERLFDLVDKDLEWLVYQFNRRTKDQGRFHPLTMSYTPRDAPRNENKNQRLRRANKEKKHDQAMHD